MIRLDKVTKSYGLKTAVHELSLDIGPGAVTFAAVGSDAAAQPVQIHRLGKQEPVRPRSGAGRPARAPGESQTTGTPLQGRRLQATSSLSC